MVRIDNRPGDREPEAAAEWPALERGVVAIERLKGVDTKTYSYWPLMYGNPRENFPKEFCLKNGRIFIPG